MVEVMLTGWRPGLKKISLTQALESYASLSLSEAKRMTDQLLSGQLVSLTVLDEKTAERFIASAVALGADASIRSSPTVRHVGWKALP